MDELTFDLLVVAASILAGTIGSLIGLGGGVIITPVLVLGFGVDIRYAMGAALTSVIATSSGAAAAYLRDGISNMRLGLFLCVATTLGAVGGAMLAVVLNQAVLSVIFGAALLITVALSVRKNPKTDPAGDPSDPLAERLRLPGTMPDGDGRKPYAVHRVVPGFLMMGVAGILSGLLGIGSGAFKVVAMDQIMRIPFKVTTATSNFMIGVTAAASVGIYLKRGYLDPALVAPVALGVLAGAFLGARLLPVAPVKTLRMIFLTLVTLIAVQMVLRGFGINWG
jgi:Predicted permeases